MLNAPDEPETDIDRCVGDGSGVDCEYDCDRANDDDDEPPLPGVIAAAGVASARLITSIIVAANARIVIDHFESENVVNDSNSFKLLLSHNNHI